MALILVADRELSNPLPGTPTIIYSRETVTSDRFGRTGVLTGSQTDCAVGGEPAVWHGSGAASSVYTAANGKANANGSGASALWLDGMPDDVEVSLKLNGLMSKEFLYLYLRGNPAGGSYGYQLRLTSAETRPGLARIVTGAGTGTNLSGTAQFSPTSKIGLRAVGNTISMLIDGAVALSVKDDKFASGGCIGLRNNAGFIGEGLSFTDFIVRAV